ncbi:MAG: hypothetical protein ABEJ62_01550 [Candidatus Nanohaloarchaea archaeon]
MITVVLSWSGSLKERFDESREEIQDFVSDMHSRGFEVGLVAEESREEVEDKLDADYAVGNVEDLSEVLSSLLSRYDKVFFVTDVEAELATANASGAFTVGVTSVSTDADDLGGVGPNYIVDSYAEFEKILKLERMD